MHFVFQVVTFFVVVVDMSLSISARKALVFLFLFFFLPRFVFLYCVVQVHQYNFFPKFVIACQVSMSWSVSACMLAISLLNADTQL